MQTKLLGVLLAGIAATAAAIGVGCGGGDSPSLAAVTRDAAATAQSASAADRPAWFPASFPLPAFTEVLSEQGSVDNGGEVTFRAPVTVARLLEILDLNLESHGYTAGERSSAGEEMSIGIESAEYSGNITVKPDGDQALMIVELNAR
jgi:hypothetical protein